MRITVFSTFFTAWGYEVSYLEFVASVVSFVGVALGITAKRITWPWWALSSVLYGIFFLQYKLYASAALQLVFIAAAVAGWYGWEPTGAKPGPFKNKYRLYTIAAIIVATLALGPVLKWLWGCINICRCHSLLWLTRCSDFDGLREVRQLANVACR